MVPRTKTERLFTSAGIQKRWAPRIKLLLDIPVEKQDSLSAQSCSRCANRVESLEKAVKLSKLWPSATWIESLDSREQKKQAVVECHQTPLRAGSKVAKRLAQAILPWELRSPSLVFSRRTGPLLRKQTRELELTR